MSFLEGSYPLGGMMDDEGGLFVGGATRYQKFPTKKHHMKGGSFWSDFAHGFKKGFTETAKIGIPIARAIVGLGGTLKHGGHKLTEAQKRKYTNAMARLRVSHGHLSLASRKKKALEYVFSGEKMPRKTTTRKTKSKSKSRKTKSKSKSRKTKSKSRSTTLSLGRRLHSKKVSHTGSLTPAQKKKLSTLLKKVGRGGMNLGGFNAGEVRPASKGKKWKVGVNSDVRYAVNHMYPGDVRYSVYDNMIPNPHSLAKRLHSGRVAHTRSINAQEQRRLDDALARVGYGY